MKLGLGTVQFGLDYGVSNAVGRTPEAEARRIVDAAYTAGVRLFDTAPSYGDSESVLGRALAGRTDARIVTKTVPARQSAKGPASLGLQDSLRRLQRSKIYGCLVHHAADLVGEGGEEILDDLKRAKEQHLVDRIGVSVYTAREIDEVLEWFVPDIVQLPASAFDQRLLASGHVADLKRRGVEIHVRSVFLQGLLLMAPSSVPPYLAAARGPLEAFDRACHSAGIDRLTGALGFALSNPLFDAVLVGVTSSDELSQVLAAAVRPVTMSYSDFALDDASLVSPAAWKR